MKKEIVYNYIGRYGKTHLWKIGETENLSKRKSDIKKEAKENNIKSAENFKFLETVSIAKGKPESWYIESTIRLILFRKGYKLKGNDHFRTDKKANEVLADFREALTIASKMMKQL